MQKSQVWELSRLYLETQWNCMFMNLASVRYIEKTFAWAAGLVLCRGLSPLSKGNSASGLYRSSSVPPSTKRANLPFAATSVEWVAFLLLWYGQNPHPQIPSWTPPPPPPWKCYTKRVGGHLISWHWTLSQLWKLEEWNNWDCLRKADTICWFLWFVSSMVKDLCSFYDLIIL